MHPYLQHRRNVLRVVILRLLHHQKTGLSIFLPSLVPAVLAITSQTALGSQAILFALAGLLLS